MKRNGKIEFLRFVFCMCVLFFHINAKLFDKGLNIGSHFNFFLEGNIAVEFFFIVSGFLMAKSALKKDDNSAPLGSATITFMKKKVLAVAGIHIVAFPLTYVTYCIAKGLSLKASALVFVQALPTFFFLNKTGIPVKEILGVEWYISCMLTVMLFMYPLCKKYQKTFTNIIAPLTATFVLGYLTYKYGHITGTTVHNGLVYKCMLRALGEIALGAAAFSISNKLSGYKFGRFEKLLLTGIEALCYLFAVGFMCSTLNVSFEIYVVIALFVGVTITFSNITYGEKLFSNKFVFFLGKLSLPVYLMQNFARNCIKIFLPDLKGVGLIITAVVVSLAFGVAGLYLSKPIDKALRNKIQKIS